VIGALARIGRERVARGEVLRNPMVVGVELLYIQFFSMSEARSRASK